MENEQQRFSWSDLIRIERENSGHSIIAWEIVAEGAIVSVQKGPSCAGMWVYMFGGPEKPEIIKELPSYMWLSGYKSSLFPNLNSYHSCPSKDDYEEVVHAPKSWMQEGKKFVEAVRNLPRE